MKLRSIAVSAFAALSVAAVGAAGAQTVVKVGSTPTGSPFTFLDTKTNTIEGVMVDIMKAVGKEAGFQVQIEPMAFSALIGSLTSKRIDAISAAMFITPERQKVVSFSDPVYTYGEGLMVPKSDTKEYKSFADMKGMTVGVQVGTAFVKPIQESGVFKEVKLYDNPPDMMRDANAGRIQGGFMDYPIAAYTISQNRNAYGNLRMVSSYKPSVTGSVGIATRKDDAELLNKINTALKKLKGDGTIDTILKKWGLDGG
ncbi:ABC transporter substrate-binding protein [Bordetella genomosp. 9]|uniref:Amino acid ABC transporter substrate-binding protein n=1 Tax=Bordetella genomosp. 9 TaxID=1416803 RepID=A0A1W6YWG1_9BORD|nr:ABC transporter substrate-binding protein [Bordetella genomosp. 9]ARP84933.1 amino acid ABC transporter substrate-binding protein [Bordetella genomosp. 9]ARP89019.1 amino acid ABC transporter substrate-binding protein [Bordetella genomosp. 9]